MTSLASNRRYLRHRHVCSTLRRGMLAGRARCGAPAAYRPRPASPPACRLNQTSGRASPRYPRRTGELAGGSDPYGPIPLAGRAVNKLRGGPLRHRAGDRPADRQDGRPAVDSHRAGSGRLCRLSVPVGPKLQTRSAVVTHPWPLLLTSTLFYFFSAAMTLRRPASNFAPSVSAPSKSVTTRSRTAWATSSFGGFHPVNT